jgi:hypothetical protein
VTDAEALRGLKSKEWVQMWALRRVRKMLRVYANLLRQQWPDTDGVPFAVAKVLDEQAWRVTAEIQQQEHRGMPDLDAEYHEQARQRRYERNTRDRRVAVTGRLRWRTPTIAEVKEDS